MVAVKHAFTSGITDGADAALVQPSSWNADHTIAAGAAGAVLAMGNSAVIWNAGTSFPGSKATGDRYYRTDLGREYYWNGTYWLSTQEFGQSLGVFDALLPFTNTNGALRGLLGRGVGSGVFVTSVFAEVQVITTNDASNHWTATLGYYPSNTLLTIGDTSAAAANAFTVHTLAVNAVPATGTDKEAVVIFAKTGSPGGLYVVSTYFYRLIGT